MGEDTPGGDGEPPRDHGIDGCDAEAFGGELAGQGEGMLPGDIGGVADGDPGGGEGSQGEGEEAGDHCLPTARLAAVGAVAGVKEILFGLAERRVAGGISANPRGGLVRGLEPAAAVEIRRVVGLAGPFGRRVLQPDLSGVTNHAGHGGPGDVFTVVYGLQTPGGAEVGKAYLSCTAETA